MLNPFDTDPDLSHKRESSSPQGCLSLPLLDAEVFDSLDLYVSHQEFCYLYGCREGRIERVAFSGWL